MHLEHDKLPLFVSSLSPERQKPQYLDHTTVGRRRISVCVTRDVKQTRVGIIFLKMNCPALCVLLNIHLWPSVYHNFLLFFLITATNDNKNPPDCSSSPRQGLALPLLYKYLASPCQSSLATCDENVDTFTGSDAQAMEVLQESRAYSEQCA